MNKNLYYKKLHAERLSRKNINIEKISINKKINSIIFDDNINFTKSDNIIINALRKKDIKIDINKIDLNIEYDLSYNLNSYKCMSSVLRDILNRYNNYNDRLLFLKDLFKNEEIVIISSGPSSKNLKDDELKYISDNYITICVKYIIDTLFEKNIRPTFFVNNFYIRNNNFKYYSDLSKDLTSILGTSRSHSEYKIYNTNNKYLIEIFYNNINLERSFNLIKKNIDCITWTTDNNTNTLFHALHIMCEIAIPLCIHLGIIKIYTVGWDLRKIDDKSYCFNDIKTNPVYFDPKMNTTEYDYIPNIKKILNNMNIEIYKIKESPILLEYKNIFI